VAYALRFLRRAARAARPSTVMVAGSGTGSAIKLSSRVLSPPLPMSVEMPTYRRSSRTPWICALLAKTAFAPLW